MNTYYCVATTVFNSGKTIMDLVASKTAENKPENTFKSTDRAEYYCDWFDTKEEAENFITENK